MIVSTVRASADVEGARSSDCHDPHLFPLK